MRKYLSLLLVGVFILLLSPVSFAAGIVTFLVEDETAAVAGTTVRLTLNGKVIAETTTNATGNCSFNGVPDGIYRIVAEREGYNQTQRSVLVRDNETTSGNIFLRMGTLVALAADGQGSPVENATVTATYPDQSVHVETTSADGRCLFAPVALGSYNIQVEKDGLQTVARDITLSDADTDQLFTLNRWFIDVTVSESGTAVPGAAVILFKKAGDVFLNAGVTNANGNTQIVIPDGFISGTECFLRIVPHSHDLVAKDLGAITASKVVNVNVSNTRSTANISSFAELNSFLTTGSAQIGVLTNNIDVPAQITINKAHKTLVGDGYTITSSIPGILTPAFQVDADYVRFHGVKFDAQNESKNFIHVRASYCSIYDSEILNEAANGKGITSNNDFGATPHQLTIANCTISGSVGLVAFINGQFRNNTQNMAAGGTEAMFSANNQSLNCRIENNTITANGKTATALDSRGAGAWIINNIIAGGSLGTYVKAVLNSPAVRVINNTIAGCGTGMRVEGDGATWGTYVLSNNTITNTDNQGIQALSVVSLVATNNTISNAGSDGFTLTTPTTYVALDHNVIENCGARGISITGLTGGTPQLRANTSRSHGGAGIYLSGTNTSISSRKNVSAGSTGMGFVVDGTNNTLDSTNDIVAANIDDGTSINNTTASFKRSSFCNNGAGKKSLSLLGTSTVKADESTFCEIEGNTDANSRLRDVAYREANNYSPEELQGVEVTVNQNSGSGVVTIGQAVANANLICFFGRSLEELANAVGGNQEQEIGIFWGFNTPTTDGVTIDLGPDEYSTQPLIVAGSKNDKPIKAVMAQPTVIDVASKFGAERKPVVVRYAGPQATVTIPWVVTNDGNYTGNFNLKATATVVPSGQDANWGVKYIAYNSDITAQIIGSGYVTPISGAFQIDIQVTNRPGATDRIEIAPIVTAGGNVESGMKATVYAAAVGGKKTVPMVSGSTLQLYVPGTQTSGIQAAASGTKTATLIIFDLSGKVIHRQDFTMQADTTVVEKSLTSLGAGTYVYQIIVDGSVFDQGRFPVLR
ncbi:MAG: right-handed parallel beta-helix repeat-containing protein [Candidatus Margulisiibacteriota bacterium]